uniref:Fork-head domain-containing protein n=1 Tax=Seriola dumerili TaxID=41447 RepID=A0A3B4UIC5_SERDU
FSHTSKPALSLSSLSLSLLSVFFSPSTPPIACISHPDPPLSLYSSLSSFVSKRITEVDEPPFRLCVRYIALTHDGLMQAEPTKKLCSRVNGILRHKRSWQNSIRHNPQPQISALVQGAQALRRPRGVGKYWNAGPGAAMNVFIGELRGKLPPAPPTTSRGKAWRLKRGLALSLLSDFLPNGSSPGFSGRPPGALGFDETVYGMSNRRRSNCSCGTDCRVFLSQGQHVLAAAAPGPPGGPAASSRRLRRRISSRAAPGLGWPWLTSSSPQSLLLGLPLKKQSPLPVPCSPGRVRGIFHGLLSHAKRG